MLSYPEISPVLFELGPLQVRWYGLMYVLGFFATYFLVQRQIRRFRLDHLAPHFENLNIVLLLCLVAGGRLGYVFFYNFSYYIQHPLEIPATWQGGMSFHGALIGLLAGGFFFCRRNRLDFFETADLYIATVPVGLFLGRLGNFINGELFGRVSDVPWAMVFPDGGPLPRHPSQLYEALLEGFFLFAILWTLKEVKHRRGWAHGTLLAAFLVFYGLFRSFVELFREPDAHLGFLLGSLTMGQLLSFAMIGAGLLLGVLRRAARR